MGSAAARHAAGGGSIELRLVELGHPECHRDLERSSVVQRHRDLLRREGRPRASRPLLISIEVGAAEPTKSLRDDKMPASSPPAQRSNGRPAPLSRESEKTEWRGVVYACAALEALRLSETMAVFPRGPLAIALAAGPKGRSVA